MLFAMRVQTGKEDETVREVERLYKEGIIRHAEERSFEWSRYVYGSDRRGALRTAAPAGHPVRRTRRPYCRIFAPKKVQLIYRQRKLVDRRKVDLYTGYIFVETRDTWPEMELAGEYGFAAPLSETERRGSEWNRIIPNIIHLAHDLSYTGYFTQLFLNRDKRWYIPLYSWEEERLLALLDDQNVVQPSRGVMMDSEPGSPLIVIEGPLMGMEGELIRIDRHKRTAVLRSTLCGEAADFVLPLEVISPTDQQRESV